MREAGLIIFPMAGRPEVCGPVRLHAGFRRASPRVLHLISRVVHFTSGFAYMTHIRLFCLLTLGLSGGILLLMQIGRAVGVRRRLASTDRPGGTGAINGAAS